MSTGKITTIKVSKETKKRLDELKEHPRESYDESLNKLINIINITVRNPMAGARIFRNIKKRKGVGARSYQREAESMRERTKTPSP